MGWGWIAHNNHYNIFDYSEEAADDFCHVYDAILIAYKAANLSVWVIVEFIAVSSHIVSLIYSKCSQQAATGSESQGFVSLWFQGLIKIGLLDDDADEHDCNEG